MVIRTEASLVKMRRSGRSGGSGEQTRGASRVGIMRKVSVGVERLKMPRGLAHRRRRGRMKIIHISEGRSEARSAVIEHHRHSGLAAETGPRFVLKRIEARRMRVGRRRVVRRMRVGRRRVVRRIRVGRRMVR